jgi:protein gp37
VGAETGIAWTDHTFNPWWGCVKVSPGCANCYAESWDRRWGGEHWGKGAPRRFFGTAHWREPLKWNADAYRAGRRARSFARRWPTSSRTGKTWTPARMQLWALIRDTPHLDWQLLTKRPENILKLLPSEWIDEPAAQRLVRLHGRGSEARLRAHPLADRGSRRGAVPLRRAAPRARQPARFLSRS